MMTAARFEELCKGGEPLDQSEKDSYEKERKRKARSDAAKRAVQTKLKKYKTWPSRSNRHK